MNRPNPVPRPAPDPKGPSARQSKKLATPVDEDFAIRTGDLTDLAGRGLMPSRQGGTPSEGSEGGFTVPQ